jgi:hypothetical protein
MRKCDQNEKRDSSLEMLSKRSKHTYNDLSDLLSLHKGLIAKKLFIRVNEQSLLISANFSIPKVTPVHWSSKSKRVQCVGEQDCSCGSFEKKALANESSFESVDLRQVEASVKAFESVARLHVLDKNQTTYLKQVNAMLVSVVSRSLASNRIASYSSGPSPSAKALSATDVSLAILRLSSKKLRLTKKTFVDLAWKVFKLDRETLLEKNAAYHFIVTILQQNVTTFAFKDGQEA